MANKTSKQLGIPSGYRLSEANCSNILKVALRHKFEKEVLKLAWKEVDIIQCISDASYNIDDLREYTIIVNKLSNGKNLKDAIHFCHGFKMSGSNGVMHLGDSGGWGSHGDIKGIISSDILEDILDNIDEKIFSVIVTNHDTTHSYKWIQQYCLLREPSDSIVQLTGSDMWKLISEKLRIKTNKHFSKCEKLRIKIEKVSTLIKSILATYTSAVKLCNDSPEFINYITDAAVYNKHGRKCTDVGTVDMIQELSQL